MYLFRALNDFDMECISKYSIISCNLFRSYLDVSTKEEAKKIMTELVNTNITTSLDRIIGHVNGKALEHSCWISTSNDLLFTLKEYAIPQSGTYNIDMYRKNVAILEFDESNMINLDSLDFKDKDEYKKMYSKALDLTNNKLGYYFDKGLIKPLSRNDYTNCVSGNVYFNAGLKELNGLSRIHGISAFASKAGENVVYYRINKDKIKRILTPLDQDILYAIFIDLIRKDKKEEENLSKIEERNYMLLALNEYLDKYANIDNDIHTSNYDFSRIEKQIIDYLYKLDKNGHYNALISLIPQYCKTTDAFDFYDKLKVIKRLIIKRITGIDNAMLLDDDIEVLNKKLYQEKKALLNDVAFKKYLNDVIYYQDSNYQIISGNELKKSLKLKPNSEK